MKSSEGMKNYSRLQPDMDYIVSNFNFNVTLQTLSHYQRHLRFTSSKVWSCHSDDTAQILIIGRRIQSTIKIIFQVQKCEDGTIAPVMSVMFEWTLLQLLWFYLQIMAEACFLLFCDSFYFLAWLFVLPPYPNKTRKFWSFINLWEVLEIISKWNFIWILILFC